ncbi:hypothetical protein [Alteromonas naphthalenivorans]|uniref:Uncharacterized protein n=1 Tax=Alteromonas naphthalenivorans TaxID=715451 RepID=F5Z5D8_ALTNA|nr:hypothetical protein [Alteromonas naphthalenivorans]AEF04864.1 hypothetical protein ambt_16795 [Alteromonas naphthalenivorans]
MELKIWGSFITAGTSVLVAVATYLWKIQREKTESNRTILYLLLELRYIFINSVIKTDQAVESYLKLYLERLRERKISITVDSAFEQELRIILREAFKSLIADMREDLKEDFTTQFENAIIELSKHNPILAYRLQNNIKIEKISGIIDNHLAKTLSWAEPTEEKNLLYFESISKKLESDLTDKLLESLEQDILTVAGSDSILTKFKCKKIIKKRNLSNMYNFSIVTPFIDDSLEIILDKNMKNT